MESLITVISVVSILVVAVLEISCGNAVDAKWTHTKILVKNGANLTNRDKTLVATSTDFYKFICDSELWIDKSRLIENLFEDIEYYVLIFTAPPGMCKTINLQMFAFFCKFNVDEHGRPMVRSESPNYKYFTEGVILHPSRNGLVQLERTTEPPLISNYANLNLHLARYPVISMSGIRLQTKEATPESEFRLMIMNAYKQQQAVMEYLKVLSNTGPLEKRIQAASNLETMRIHSTEDEINKLSLSALTVSIERLSEVLYQTYRSNVIIIYDEHTAFVNDVFGTDRFSTYMDSAVFSLYETFLHTTFKANQYLKKAIITGALPLHEGIGLSCLNNVKTGYIFSDVNFFPYYGVYRPEFDSIAALTGINDTCQNETILRYDGYRILDHLDVQMFSTNSIKGFVNQLPVMKQYWESSSLVNIISRLFRQALFQSHIADLAKNWETESLFVTIPHSTLKLLTLDQYKRMNDILLSENEHEYTLSDRPVVFSYLLYLGLLGLHPTQRKSYFEYIGYSSVRLKIANCEVNKVFRQHLSRYQPAVQFTGFRTTRNQSETTPELV